MKITDQGNYLSGELKAILIEKINQFLANSSRKKRKSKKQDRTISF